VRNLLRLLPRLARMIASLLSDRDVPTTAKVVLGALAFYLASPIDLIPDVIPLLGFLDDVLLAAVVVDGLLNHLDRRLVERYWPGDVAALDAVAAVARRLAAWVPLQVKTRIFGGHRAA
jgi:uncharacterized membrane protein YkvA (DUF1232 family)